MQQDLSGSDLAESPRTERHEVAPMSHSGRLIHAGIRVLVRVLARSYFRLSVHGRERIPLDGPFLVVGVHRSNLDAFLIGAALPSRRILRCMAKESLWEHRSLGRFLEMMGSFPVSREHADRASLRCCEQVLAHGDLLLMFPEGKRMSGPMIQSVHNGPAWVACRYRVPVLPVAVAGTEQALRPGAKFPRPFRVAVVIGEPIYPDVPLTGRVPRHSVTDLTGQIKKELQDSFNAATSPNAGSGQAAQD
jgi:1-acyl-sn-glycerol-3-phosphate acyltransferase